MLKWIGKVLGGSSVVVPEGVPSEWAERLAKVLKPLDKAGPKARAGLADDTLQYILAGEPNTVLAELGTKEAGEALKVIGFHHGQASTDVPELYAHLGTLPASVGLRWAQVLETSAAASHNAFTMTLPNGKHWPEVMMLHCAGWTVNGWSSDPPKLDTLSAVAVEQLLVEDGLPASALLTVSFATPIDSHYGAGYRLVLPRRLAGYADALHRHREALRPLLLPAKVAQRQHVLAMLDAAQPATLDTWAPELCELATGGSKQIRSAAELLVRRGGSAMVDPLRQIAVQGKPEPRQHALRLLFEMGKQDDALRQFAVNTARADAAPSVQALVEEWEAATQHAEISQDMLQQYTVPVIDWSAKANPISDELLNAFWSAINESIAKANKQSREHYERAKAQNQPHARLHTIEPYTQRDAQQLRDHLSSDQIKPPPRTNRRHIDWQYIPPALQTLLNDRSVTAVAAFKVLNFFGIATHHDGTLLHPAVKVFETLHRRDGRPTLLEISQMLPAAGGSGETLLRDYCHGWGTPIASDWPAEHVWPYVAHHLDHVVHVLLHNTVRDYYFSRNGLFRAIATLPTPPAAVVNALFSLALGSGKTDRLPAQQALHRLPGKEERIVQALSDGKAETRAIAAQWLGRLRHEKALPALERAVLKEKHDVAKGAMLDALQAMGQAVERYLDRDALAAEAAKALAKGVPKDVEWFPWSALPPVRWQDNQTPVPADALRWLLVQAVKQKSPEPNAVLRKYCSMFEPRDREALGQMVLETWLREDVAPISPDEAMRRASNAAQSTFQSMKQYPQYYKDSPNLGKSEQELLAMYLPGELRVPKGSAIGSKGLLAVAAACAAERAAAPTQRYLKEWYGSRAAQGKALIAMLAWIEHPSATQLMLSIGSRFRTKSFQEEATRQAEALAERKGWTLAELADRTIPSAGFDETGTLTLGYGPREFSAKLLPDFKVELFNPEGKKIASLPEPRQDDDAEQAKDAKKAYSAAKKEIKAIVDLQTDRLYEALCTERDWPFSDWRDYLARHPVVRHLVQRLVWAQVDGDRVLQTFRPLDDGTLSDRDDNEITLADDARVRVAHDSLLSADEVVAWQQHLVDYEIKPLFQQLGKGTYQLPAERADKDEIRDFEGHLLEAFALRGRALKLGYTRGPAEDGGWFLVYEKRFPTLGLEATIEFTGNPLPEENRTVALLSLSFSSTSSGANRWERGRLPLSKVPKVLLSECYNDLRLIAAEGTGYDADWQKKSEY